MEKFGSLLSSRPAGRDAFSGFAPILAQRPPEETLELDFAGVNVLAPSWADEFVTPLARELGARLRLLHVDNPSVTMTLELLEETNGLSFNRV